MSTQHKHSGRSAKQHIKCLILLLALALFVLTGTYIYHEMQELQSEPQRQSILSIILHKYPNSAESPSPVAPELILMNAPQQNDTEKKIRTIIGRVESEEAAGRSVRATDNNNTKNGGYYEEQQPVVVHSESGPIMGYAQPPQVPSSEEVGWEDPIYAPALDYAGTADGRSYEDAEQRQAAEEDYFAADRGDYSAEQPYEADQGRAFRAQGAQGHANEAAAEQQRQYDAYYRQWHYATPSPPMQHTAGAENRKLQMSYGNNYGPHYDDDLHDYDYAPVPPSNKQKLYAAQQQMLQRYATHAPATTLSNKNAQKRPSSSTEMQGEESNSNILLTVLRSLKALWDIYQAFAAAWNAMAAHNQKQEQLQQQKIKNQQPQQPETRINSKRPTKFNAQRLKNSKNNNAVTTQTTTTRPSAATSTRSTSTTEPAPAKVEPRQKLQNAQKDEQKGDVGMIEVDRRKRAAGDAAEEGQEVAEGRYIKGDPLKGYYDFVITEGSYKFWAVFQVGTAILIIYSTFAAIYYSKVNPLVSDYDYVDYLGGGRSLSGGDLDFVDDGADPQPKKARGHWYDWVPRVGHSLQFVLDAIDKLPGDHMEDIVYAAGPGNADLQATEAGDVVDK